MTLRLAERIIGFDIDLYPDPDGGYVASSNWERGQETFHGRNRDAALRGLVETIYRLRSEWVMKNQGWRCKECGRLGSLEIDHIIPRSKGRDDRISNLRAVCPSGFGCKIHQKKHG